MTRPHGSDTDVHLDLLGRRIEVSCGSAQAAKDLAYNWSRCVRPTASGIDRSVVLQELGSTPSAHVSSLTKIALEAVDSDLALRASGAAAAGGAVVAVVGGAVSDRDEVVLGLCEAGYTYVGGVLVVDGSSGVASFQRPLVIDGATDVRLAGPDELGLAGGPKAGLRLGTIVIVERRPPGPSIPSEPLGIVPAVVALLPHLERTASEPRPLCALFRLLNGSVRVIRWATQDSRDPRSLLAGLDTAARPPEIYWRALDPDPRPPGSTAWALRDGRVRQTPYRDVVETSEGAIVAIGDDAIQLGPLGLTIWQAAASAPTMQELTELSTDVHGPHPDAVALVGDAVTKMVGRAALGFERPIRIDAILPAGRPKPARWRLRARPSD